MNMVICYDTRKMTMAIDRKTLSEYKGISDMKYFLIVGYLRKHLQVCGEVKLSLNSLIEGCGYSLTYRGSDKYKSYRNILKGLSEKRFITIRADIDNVKPSAYFDIVCTNELFCKRNNFVIFNIYEFDKIVCYEKGVIGKSVLAGVYLYVKQFITLEESIENGRYFVFPSLKVMADELDILVNTCRYALRELVDIGLLYCMKNFYIESKDVKGYYVPTRCTYALNGKYLFARKVKDDMAKFYGRTVYSENEVRGKIIYCK